MKNTIKKLSVIALCSLIVFGTVKVSAAPSPKLNITDIRLSVGQSANLKVTGAKKIKWSSSKKKITSVNRNGKIKAKKKCTATITAKVSGKKLKCRVTVGKKVKGKKNVLITYFSHTGTTKAMVKKVQKITNGDLLRVTPKKKYTDDYDTLTEIAQDELNKDVRPAVTTVAKNIKSYNVIYVGYPIWWGTTPRVVNTFLEKYNFKGKTVIPFCTSGGSMIDGSISDMKDSAKGAKFKNGYTADKGTKSEIKKWLKKIGEIK